MRKVLMIAVGAIAIGSSVAHAQIAVFDAAVTARDSAIAAAKQILIQIQQRQLERLDEMARRLSALTSLRKYVLEDVPRWRTHGGDEYVFSAAYNDALIFGDPSGAAYRALAQPLVTEPERLEALPLNAQRTLRAALATIDATDAVAIAATNDTGQLRFNGRKRELPAIDDLEADVIDPSEDQSTTAVLDKISGAELLGARQRQARIQLLTGILEQVLVDSKRDRDAEATSLNMQLTTWREGRAANEAFVTGSADALRTWRQP